MTLVDLRSPADCGFELSFDAYKGNGFDAPLRYSSWTKLIKFLADTLRSNHGAAA